MTRNQWTGWPFKSPLGSSLSTTAPADLPDDDPEDDSPYCRCDNLPRDEEVKANRCLFCGKVLM